MKERNRRKDGGFTLVELLMVMAVISVLVALTLPNLVGTRKAANEANAIEQLRTVVAAQESFKARNLGNNGYLYGTLAQLETKALMKWPTAGTYKKDGFTFTDVVAPTATSYAVYADAFDVNSGDRDFAIMNDGTVRSQVQSGTTPTTLAGVQALAYIGQ